MNPSWTTARQMSECNFWPPVTMTAKTACRNWHYVLTIQNLCFDRVILIHRPKVLILDHSLLMSSSKSASMIIAPINPPVDKIGYVSTWRSIMTIFSIDLIQSITCVYQSMVYQKKKKKKKNPWTWTWMIFCNLFPTIINALYHALTTLFPLTTTIGS